MRAIISYLLFFLGLSIGSFLNVLIYRLPNDLRLAGRSICPYCKKQIAWYDNIPLLSFILLRGKCRQCHSPIGWQYPVVELATGALFVLTFLLVNSKNVIELVYYLFIFSSLIVVFFADLRYGIIPDKIVYPLVILSMFYLFIFHNSLFIIYLLSAFGSFAFLLLLFLVTRGRGMGMGDVKLAFLMGLFLGFPKIIIALYLSFLTGAAISLILVLWGKKKFFGATIPFGPFLVFGTFAAFFAGGELLRLVSPWLSF